MLRLGLRSARVRADWVNIWEDTAAAARVRAITGGDETVPTIVVGAQAMVNPPSRQVVAAIRAGQTRAGRASSAHPAARLARAVSVLTRRWPWRGRAVDAPHRSASG